MNFGNKLVNIGLEGNKFDLDDDVESLGSFFSQRVSCELESMCSGGS